MKKNEDDFFALLRKIEQKPNSTQRELANILGFSLGKLNYCIKELNKGYEEKLTHKKLKINNSFNFFSEDSKKNGLLESCHILKGNCIAFDAYSLHSSNDNTSNSHRLSLKIVTKEKNKSFNNKKGLEIKKLLNKNLTKSNTYIYLFWAAGIISKFLNYIKSKNFF